MKRVKLNRSQVRALAALTGYPVDTAGLITAEGRFLGQPAYVVEAFCAYLEGEAEKAGDGEFVAAFPARFGEVVPTWAGREQVRFVIENDTVRECE